MQKIKYYKSVDGNSYLGNHKIQKKNVDILQYEKLIQKVAWKVYHKHKIIDLNDLIQEGFIIGLKSIHTYDNNRASFSTYLYRNLYGYLIEKVKSEYRKTNCVMQITNCPELQVPDFSDDLMQKTDLNHATPEVKLCCELFANERVKGRPEKLSTRLKKKGFEPEKILRKVKIEMGNWNVSA